MRRSINAVSWLLGLLSGLCIMVLIFLTFSDVFWRNLTGRSIPGAYEYSEVILVAMVFLSIAWTQRIDGHVSIDLVVRALPPRAGHWLRSAGIAVAIVVLSWMMIASGKAALFSFLSGEYRFGLAQVPVWPARAAVALGTGMLVLQLALHLIEQITLPRVIGDQKSRT